MAVFAAVHAATSGAHSYLDVVAQHDVDARRKGLPGWLGRLHCARHVATYASGQYLVAFVVTRVLGRVPTGPLLAGTAVNAVTHYVVDRRAPLWRFLRSRWARRLRLVGGAKADYAQFAVVQRNGVVDPTGPGTAYYEIDAAVHQLLGVIASLTTAWLAMRATHHANAGPRARDRASAP